MVGPTKSVPPEKVHFTQCVLTPTQANGQLLEASAGLGMAAQRLAAYEAAEVNCVQREGPKQGGAGVAELAGAEEVAEEV
jgi:hypothetical protein